MPHSLKCKIKHLCHNGTITENERDRILKALEQEKTGHWEWVQYDANPEIGNFHCSECQYMPASFNMSAKKLNYCPNCGADMRGER